MLDKKWISISSKVYFVTVAVGFSALWFSPFLVSLATVLSGLFFLLNLKNIPFKDSPIKFLFIGLGIVALPSIIDGILSGFSGVTGDKLGLMIGFLFSSLAGLCLMGFKREYLLQFAMYASMVVVVINVIALTNYFLHKEEIDALLLQSKSIPIPNMHHIHFGIINAICVLLLIGLLVEEKARGTIQKWLTTLLLIVIFLSTHILSSRTGLLSLYIALVAGALYFAFHSKNYKVALWVVLGLIVFSFGAYASSNSLKNKIANSIEDVNSWGQDEEINHKSMAMRIEAYKASAHIIKTYPSGVGANSLESKMEEGYEAIESPLWQENRIGPHNQFLEYGVKYGWLGIVAVLLFIGALAKYGFGDRFVYLSFVLLIIVSLQFESLLERQTSLYFLAVFMPLFFHLFAKTKIRSNPIVS